MFNKLNQLAFAAAITVAGFVASSASASAMPVGSSAQIATNEFVLAHMQNSAKDGRMNMNWQSRRDGNRCRTRYGNCRHYYQGYYYETPWWTLPFIIGSTIANGNHGRSHVEWCLSRYRSYNPRTDTWLGNSGRRYRCRGPY